MQVAPQLVNEALQPTGFSAPGNCDPYTAPSGVYRCAGDDEWCVVTVRGDHDWARPCSVMDRDDLRAQPRFATTDSRIAHRREVDDALSDWTSRRSPTFVMTILQRVGIPAGAMVRLPELLTDPHLLAREAYTQLEHDKLPMMLPTAKQVAHFETLRQWPLRPAPSAGQQTREICRDVVGLTDQEIDTLIQAGTLQPGADDPAFVSASPPPL